MWKFYFACLFAIVMIYAVLIGIPKTTCKYRWDSNETKYDFIGGCKVKGEDGKWYPEKNFRAN